MKKNLSLAFAIAALVTISYGGIKKFHPLANKSEMLLMENIEALASGEGATKEYTCYNTVTSKDGCQVRYCPTCSFVPGTDPWYEKSSNCRK